MFRINLFPIQRMWADGEDSVDRLRSWKCDESETSTPLRNEKKMGMIIRWNIPFYVLLYNQLLLNPSIFMKICVCHIILRCMINKRRCYATWFVSTWNFIIHSKYLKCSYQNKYRCKEWTVKCLKSWIWFYSRHVNEFQIFFKSWLIQIQWLYSSNMDFHFLMNYFVPTSFEKL